MYDSDEYFLDEMPAEDVDWNDEFTEMAETLRDSLEDDYGATTKQMQEALLDVFDSLSPAESFNLGKALSQIEKGASSAIRDPTIGQLARTALPLAGGAVGTLVGGTARNSCGKPRRPGGRPSPSGVKPSKADGRDPPAAPGVANGSAAALQGLVLTQKPEVLKSLLAVALGQHGRKQVDGVPVGSGAQPAELRVRPSGRRRRRVAVPARWRSGWTRWTPTSRRT